jgi:hypothetical protein
MTAIEPLVRPRPVGNRALGDPHPRPWSHLEHHLSVTAGPRESRPWMKFSILVTRCHEQKRRFFPFAKVDVEGSNPFSRSNIHLRFFLRASSSRYEP